MKTIEQKLNQLQQILHIKCKFSTTEDETSGIREYHDLNWMKDENGYIFNINGNSDNRGDDFSIEFISNGYEISHTGNSIVADNIWHVINYINL